MTKRYEIIIDVHPDGTLESTVLGVKGADCTKLSKWIDELGNVTEDKHTKEYNEKPADARITLSQD